MPSFSDTSSGYVQWQSARRQAKQLAHDAAIDIIEHYNRVMLNDDNRHGQGRTQGYDTGQASGGSLLNGFAENESPRVDVYSKGKKLTPRALNKKTTTLRAENVDRKSGVFTEGISSFSRHNQFPLSLKRNDIISENLPDTIKMAREKSRIYLALSQPGSKQSRDSYRMTSKADYSAKSLRTLPPPSYPWSEFLSVPEITRSKTFTGDDRAGLCTRSTLDSRQTASDIHPVSDKKNMVKQGTQIGLFYPSITGAPPNTPLCMPAPFKPKVPSVSIVSLGGETIDENSKKPELRSRLPVPFKSVISRSSMGANSDSKQSSKPGIDLPHLPLRYTDTKDAGSQFTPRERPGKMSYNTYYRGRRRIGIGQLKQGTRMKSEALDPLDRDERYDMKTPTDDPYASRFMHPSSVASFGETYTPSFPTIVSGPFPPESETQDADFLLPEPTVMLTVQEEDESSQSAAFHRPAPQEVLANPEELDATLPPQLSERVKNRTQSLVSNNSLLSAPLIAKDLSEARPPAQNADTGAVETITVEIPVFPAQDEAEEHKQATEAEVPKLVEPEAEDEPLSNPQLVSPSLVETARTVATQTSLPYNSDMLDEKQPTLVKIKTLSMFPDINGAEGLNDFNGQMPTGATNEPMLRLSHGESFGDGKMLGFPEIKTAFYTDKDSSDGDRSSGSKSKCNGVQNITFISPLEGQQKAKRF